MKSFHQFTEELELHEAKQKAVVFMFGRFNPPTAGHEKMVERAVAIARKQGIRDVRLYPSLSQDAKRNPLAHKEKVKFLRRFFPKVKVIDNRDAVSPFAVARLFTDEGMKRVVMVAGSDRVNEFRTNIGKYVNHSDPEKSYDFEEFSVIGAGARDPDSDDVSGMSASKMRGFAASKDFGNFAKGLPSRANRRDADALFAAVRKGMNLRESVSYQLSAEERDATFADKLRAFKSPDVAEDGHCYSVVWADGRGIVAYRNRSDAIKFIEQGDRDPVRVRYEPSQREGARNLIVRNSFSPDRKSVREEWPDQLNELSQIVKFWYDTKRNKLLKVSQREVNHDWAPIMNPPKFGLKGRDVLPYKKDMDSGDEEIPEVKDLMFSKGWVRLGRVQNYWTCAAANLKQAAQAVQAMAKKVLQDPEVIYIDYDKGKYVNLMHNQIKAFLQTGKVVQQSKMAAFRREQLDERIRDLDKWWYNTKTRKAIEISANYHDQGVARDPKKFGLTPEILDKVGVTQDDLDAARANKIEVIPPLEFYMHSKGWVQVTWSRNIEELTFRAESIMDVRNALKWGLVKVHPSPATVVSDSDDTGFIRLRQDQIDGFVKTGRVPRSRVGAFR